jgi:hypothetical protein
MRRSILKAIGTASVALAMALGSTNPSLAFHGGFGGFHGGFGGGFHGGFGGGFHPGFGGFHPGFRPGFAGLHPGLHPFFPNRRFAFHRGFFRNGVFVNGWWGPAVVAGAWSGGYDGCWTYRPTYDAGGNYLGYSYVNLCS